MSEVVPHSRLLLSFPVAEPEFDSAENGSEKKNSTVKKHRKNEKMAVFAFVLVAEARASIRSYFC